MADPRVLLRATKAITAIDRMPTPAEAEQMQDDAGGLMSWRLQCGAGVRRKPATAASGNLVI